VVSQPARANGVRSALGMLLIVAAPLLAAAVAQVSAFTSPLIVVGLASLAVWPVWHAVIVARGWTPLALCNQLAIALLSRVVSLLFPPVGLILAPLRSMSPPPPHFWPSP
jgi:hypothetical protein